MKLGTFSKLATIRISPCSILGCILVLPILCLAPASRGRAPQSPLEITFRFINPESGKPASGMVIGIAAWNVDTHPSKATEIVASINTKTDKAGKIIFHLPQPIPKHMGISTDPYLVRGCAGKDIFSPDQVFRFGAVATYNSAKCGPTRVVMKATPGEVVLLERPLSLTERMRREVP